MYSVVNPVFVTFFAIKTSPLANPDIFSTLIVVSEAPTAEPVIVVELATNNCPPTAFTVSFSNVVVASVPLTLTFSNSANPLSSADIIQPEKSET